MVFNNKASDNLAAAKQHNFKHSAVKKLLVRFYCENKTSHHEHSDTIFKGDSVWVAPLCHFQRKKYSNNNVVIQTKTFSAP